MKNWSKEGWRWLSKIDFHGNVASKVIVTRRFGSGVNGGKENEMDVHKLTREFLVKLWVDDIKMRNPRWFSATSALPRRPKRRPVLKQPPISQSLTDFFDPQSPQEVNSCA